MTEINRRQMLCGTGAFAACATVGLRRAAAAPRAEVRDTRVISHLPHRYHGWPTLARRSNGQLLVVCSGGREAHVCPFGRVDLIRSDDDGATWSWPRVVMDGPIDDRDAGVLETQKGTILITTFTSLAYEPILTRAEKIKPGESGAWPEDKLARWRAAHHRVTAEQRQDALDVWMIRSTDGGVTFSGRCRCGVNSPHGPIQLSDGRLLYAGKELWHGEHRIGACESTDDGASWQWLAQVPTREGDSHQSYHELHAVEAADGRIVAQIRNHNQANAGETLQAESSDGGKSWSTPRSIGVWGLPSHLLRLGDDRLLMTYGHRRKPYGNQARVSDDHGRTWSEPVIVSGDGPGGDLGYPTTAQLGDGSLVTVWYERMSESPMAV
ncbi:MAG: sialidase family protein, partial [Planctomycetota bacterium]